MTFKSELISRGRTAREFGVTLSNRLELGSREGSRFRRANQNQRARLSPQGKT